MMIRGCYCSSNVKMQAVRLLDMFINYVIKQFHIVYQLLFLQINSMILQMHLFMLIFVIDF